MFCPKCGQQQVADNTRFCSRCGLAISGLAEWIASGGVLTARAEVAPPPALASPRRNGIRRGAKLMFWSGVLLPIFFGFCFLVDGPGPLLVPITIFLAGLTIMLYARLFGDEFAPAGYQPPQPAHLGAVSGANALPPATNIWLNGVAGQQVRTNELAQPPSVTEHTTKLLDSD